MGSDNVTHGSCFGDAEEPDQPEGWAVLAASSKRTDFVPGQRVDCGQGDDEPAECCGGLLKQADMLRWPAGSTGFMADAGFGYALALGELPRAAGLFLAEVTASRGRHTATFVWPWCDLRRAQLLRAPVAQPDRAAAF